MSSKTSQRSTGKTGGKPPRKGAGRKPIKPIRPALPWGMIALATTVGLIAVGIIGYGVYTARDADKPFGERNAQQIEGVKNFRKTDKAALTQNHKDGKLEYKQSPPVGGDHNLTWQNCEGAVYDKPIAKEHAVHSLEHGAVWLAYDPKLSQADVAKLADKIKGTDFTMMSPYEGLGTTVSLQAWGFQLKLDKIDDARIDKFITGFARAATMEPQAGCQGGTTATGNEPQGQAGAPQPPAGG